MLSNGMGGMDWGGMTLVCAWLGVTDPEDLMNRIRVIRRHAHQAEARRAQEQQNNT
jgi:hypothetical protein